MTDKECEVYLRGFVDGLKPYAWWRDGKECVGTSGTTLARAVDCATSEGFYNMPREVMEYLQAKKDVDHD